jgi:glycosyltransferase involved in cell wall biosynthesis
MRIALLSTDYLPNIGGVAQHIYELSRALQADGADVEVICVASSAKWGDFRKEPWLETCADIPTFRIPWVLNRSIKFFSGQISARISQRLFMQATGRRLAERPPDVLHWHAVDVRNFSAAAFQGTKIWTNHTSNFIEGIRQPSSLASYQTEAASAEAIICPSEELADLTVQIGVPRDKVHFISNGVDSRRFRPDVDTSIWRSRLGLGPGTRLVLCPRRLEKKNGVRFFVEAALKVLADGQRDCVFAVAGNYTGPRHDSDEDLVAAMIDDSAFGGSFRLLGRVENREIPGLYAASDFVVMPSLLEATSLSAMEAMASGKAVLSTNVGGLPFLVRDEENGMLVPPADASALANGMKRLLADPELRARMGTSGRQRVEEDLDWSKIARQTLDIYRHAGADLSHHP